MAQLSKAYRPRRPEETVLFGVLKEHLPSFIAQVEAGERSVPDFVREELEGLLICGVLEHGFARALCGQCGEERLVPFSCKGRICPSCGGRRMADTAARLVDQVLPHQPHRQWVLSLPHALRYLLAYDATLCGDVLRIFVDEVFSWLRSAARRAANLPLDTELSCGSVTAIQRADSACRLNLHFHTLALDGCFIIDDAGGAPTFIATPAPTRADISHVAWSTCLGVVELLKSRGLALDAQPEDVDALAATEALLADCAAGSMLDVVIIGPRQGKRVLRLRDGPNATDPKTHRPAHGFDVNAARRASAHDRKALERMCRYILRPPFAHDRLTRLQDGRVKLRLKRSWSDGTSHLVHDPVDFIARLVPLIAQPRSHQVRYHGALASASKHRSAIVPEPKPDEPIQLRLFTKGKPSAQLLVRRIRWAKLMARVFGFDPLRCPKCERVMRIVAFVTEPRAIADILARRESPRGPRPHGARAPPQLELPFVNTDRKNPRAA